MIPAGYRTENGIRLGGWLTKQREQYRVKTLNQRRIRLLKNLGIAWNPLEERRNRFQAAAADYYRRNGNLDIPCAYITEDGLHLGGWLAEKRKKHRKGKITKESVKLREELKLKLDVFEENWEEMFQEAKRYRAEFGNLWMSPDYVTPQGVRLGGWISGQRKKYFGKDKSRKLSGSQLRRLDDLGMVWEPYEVKWRLKYEEARAFYERHGHLKIGVDYCTESGVKLGMWLGTQRQAEKGNPNYHMTEERKKLLDDIGMVWGHRGGDGKGKE